jgi:hypothetical protein
MLKQCFVSYKKKRLLARPPKLVDIDYFFKVGAKTILCYDDILAVQKRTIIEIVEKFNAMTKQLDSESRRLL